MRIDLIAPVRLSARPALDLLLASDISLVCRVLATTTGLPPDASGDNHVNSPDGIIFEQEPNDAVLLPRYLCRGPVALEGLETSSASAVREAEVAVTPYGLAIFGFIVEVEDASALEALERQLCGWVAAASRALVPQLGAALATCGLLVEEPVTLRALPQNCFLWWHRVLDGCVPPGLESVSALDRFPDHVLRPGTILRVGDGYSMIRTEQEDERRQLIEGLHCATQLWLVSDRLQRQLTEQTARLRAAVTRSDAALESEQQDALRVCEESLLESHLLLEQQRYLSGARRQAVEAAASAWRMPLDLSVLFHAADGVRAVVDRRVQQRRELQADRLNRLLAALTVVTALSVILMIFETAVGAAPELFVSRAVVAGAVAVTSAVALVTVWRRMA